MRSFLPVLFWPAFLRWKEHDDLLCSLPSHSSFSLHSIITHLTHHLIAASHSFTASPTPRAAILARLRLSHQYFTFISATSAGNFIDPQPSTKHDKTRQLSITKSVGNTTCDTNISFFEYHTTRTNRRSEKKEHGSHKDERLAL